MSYPTTRTVAGVSQSEGSPTSATRNGTPNEGVDDISYITTGSRKPPKKGKLVYQEGTLVDSTSALTDEEDGFIIVPKAPSKPTKKGRILDDDEHLIDTTAALTLHSKKTKRSEKQLQKKQQKAAKRPNPTSLLDLPPELLEEVASYLRPSDVFQLIRTSRGVRGFIYEHESAIAREIIQRRYWVLSRCFVSPVSFENTDDSARPALLSETRQNMLQIHRKPYQHVKGVDPLKVCTCVSCVFAWNNLNMILDLSHWQRNLNRREPIPMIPRGTTPEWNRKLVEANADIVEKAMKSRLVYTAILEKHLQTTVATIFRTFRGRKTVHPKRLYHLTPTEAVKETDEFLERSGPPSYEFPWHRDNYYGLEAYAPNRKWNKDKESWAYYPEGQHEKDLQWVKEKFTPVIPVSPTAKIVTEHFEHREAKT
jgi:hypothetical protein